MSMIHPRIFLAILTAIFRPTTPTTFGKLPLKLLPLSTFEVCTLPNTTTRVVFPAKVSHHHASPVLHILRVVSHSELLDQRKNVKVVRQKVFFLLFFL